MTNCTTRRPQGGPSRIVRPLLLGAAAVLPAGLAGAAEITVKNDSVVEGSTAAIQAGFVAGESAAAWLTAPCDGNIVAVQVFWRSLTGTTGQQIEDSITIYDGGSFPLPGTELALLEAPLMTDGVLNEFRYLDENQTVPLSIPVTTGQMFIVSFTFFNNPSPENGPSVVTDIDGCQSGKNAIFCVSGGCSGWTNPCPLGVSGDFMIRAVVECGAVPEACCLDDGSCTIVLAEDCGIIGGAPQGVGSCISVNCDQACCFDGGGCIDFDIPTCIAAGGFQQGAGTECATIECFASGACCMPDGTCGEDVLQEDCAAGGGIFQGSESLCMDVTCPQPLGACCFPTGFCTELDEATCLPAGATWAGPMTDCTDADMNGTADECEVDTCPADIDGDDDIDFQDLLAILANWGPCIACPADIDGDDDVDFQDLLTLLANWGTCPP